MQSTWSRSLTRSCTLAARWIGRFFLLLVGVITYDVSAVAVTLPDVNTQHGQWLVKSGNATSDNQRFISILTGNNDGAILGRWCYENGQCDWMLGHSTSCPNGAMLDVLVNSSSGSILLKARCDGAIDAPGATMYRLHFDNGDALQAVLKRSKTASFAIPLGDGDHFRVNRFDLDGITASLAQQNAILQQHDNPPAPSHGSDDRVI